MWIKIKKGRFNLDKVSDYGLYGKNLRFYYLNFTGEDNDEQHYEDVVIDDESECKEIIKKLDKLLKVVEI